MDPLLLLQRQADPPVSLWEPVEHVLLLLTLELTTRRKTKGVHQAKVAGHRSPQGEREQWRRHVRVVPLHSAQTLQSRLEERERLRSTNCDIVRVLVPGRRDLSCHCPAQEMASQDRQLAHVPHLHDVLLILGKTLKQGAHDGL